MRQKRENTITKKKAVIAFALAGAMLVSGGAFLFWEDLKSEISCIAQGGKAREWINRAVTKIDPPLDDNHGFIRKREMLDLGWAVTREEFDRIKALQRALE